MTYQYICNDPLEKKINYEYSPYLGQLFIDQWINYRDQFKLNSKNLDIVSEFENIDQLNIHSKNIATKEFINFLKINLNKPDCNSEYIVGSINWLIKRFELSKRIYTNYKRTKKGGKGIGAFRDLILYLDFAELLIKNYQIYKHLPSYNSLIKCLDIVICYEKKLNKKQKIRLSNIIKIERELFLNLKSSYLGLLNKKYQKKIPKKQELQKNSTNLPKVLFIAADTIRSRGYAQSLIRNGLKISNSLFIKSKSISKKIGKTKSPPTRSKEYINGIFNPDPQVSLEESLKKLSDNIKVMDGGTINSKSVKAYIENLKPNLIIYSGFGGEIVSNDLIDTGVPFLHLHAGILPSFRGSTTIYYSLLKTARCGVSAILLSSQIDAGEIIAYKHYSPPNCDCNLDYEYDTAIRSDLLVEVMNKFHKNKFQIKANKQENNLEETYYVIHPLLKHLAIIHLNQQNIKTL